LIILTIFSNSARHKAENCGLVWNKMVSNNYMQKGNGLRIAVGITMLALMLAGGAGASTFTVNASSGADYTRIQDAIDNASNGDTIFQNGNISEKASDANIRMLERVQAQPFKSNVSSKSRFDINSLKSEHKAGELLVTYNRKSPQKDIENFYKLQKMTLIKDYPGIGYHLIRVEESRLEKTLEALSLSDKFENAEPNYIVKAVRTPNDSRFNELWAMNNIGQIGGKPDADIDATKAWDISTGSKKVIVAVIDTGVDYTHEDLADNMWTNRGEIPGNGIDDDNNGFIDDYYGWDFAYDDNDPMDVYSHGTHVSGTIGGVGNNGKGVAGVSWNVSIMAVKFLDDYGYGYNSDAIDAINYATMMGADIMSNSWGGGGYSSAL
jgi:subtilisin family serine protease